MPRERSNAPWLDKRGETYYAFWYDADAARTKRCSLHTKDASEARTAFGQFLINGRTIYENTEDGLSVSNCLDRYYREHVEVKCVDTKGIRIVIEHLKAFFQDTLMADVDIPACRLYAEARRNGEIGSGRGRKPKNGVVSDGTIRRELSILNAAANHAIKWRYLPMAEKPSIELPPLEEQSAQWLTVDEVESLFALAEDDDRCFIRIAYFTAARRASVENLTVQQIDFTNKRIDLRTPGKRQTKKRQAIVPLYDEIAGDIEWLMDRRESDRLFPKVEYYEPFKRLSTLNGHPDRSHPHILRHSRATHLLIRGVRIYDVAMLLNDTVTTVERTYGHHSSEYLEATTSGM